MILKRLLERRNKFMDKDTDNRCTHLVGKNGCGFRTVAITHGGAAFVPLETFIPGKKEIKVCVTPGSCTFYSPADTNN